LGIGTNGGNLVGGKSSSESVRSCVEDKVGGEADLVLKLLEVLVNLHA